MALITLLINELRHRRIVVPVLPVLERLTIAARSRARRKAYRALNGDLTFEQRQHLDRLLELRGESRQTWLGWLRQAIGAANPNNILACIERLAFIRQLLIPIEWARRIHQNRLVQIAREALAQRLLVDERHGDQLLPHSTGCWCELDDYARAPLRITPCDRRRWKRTVAFTYLQQRFH